MTNIKKNKPSDKYPIKQEKMPTKKNDEFSV